MTGDQGDNSPHILIDVDKWGVLGKVRRT